MASELDRVVAGGPGTRSNLDVLVVLSSQERRWYEWTVHNLLGDPLVEGLVIEQRDVTERLQHQEALAHAASHDDLTGLPNRSRLLDRLADDLSEAAPGAGVAVLFLDLDRFKSVNDTHGHAAGDQVLVALSKRLRAGLRPHDHLARISGDEFCAILTEVRDEAEVDGVVGRLSAMCDLPVGLDDGTRVEVGVSIGVALAFSSDHGPDALLARADDDMYADKRARRWRLPIARSPEPARQLIAVDGSVDAHEADAPTHGARWSRRTRTMTSPPRARPGLDSRVMSGPWRPRPPGSSGRGQGDHVRIVDTPTTRVHHPGDLLALILSALGIAAVCILAVYAQGTTTGVTEDVQGFASTGPAPGVPAGRRARGRHHARRARRGAHRAVHAAPAAPRRGDRARRRARPGREPGRHLADHALRHPGRCRRRSRCSAAARAR